MAFTDLTINEGDCIDGEYLSAAFENLEFFRECASINSGQFVCLPIDETKTSAVTASGTELCFTLKDESNTNPNEAQANEKKMLLVNFLAVENYNVTGGDVVGTFATIRSARLLCEGEVIDSLDVHAVASPIIAACFTCSSRSVIELCFDSELRQSNQSAQVRATQTIQVCGSLVCIKDTSNSIINGLFVPPKFKPECCYGRESIHLLSQNVAALRQGFSEFGQVPSCTSFNFEDEDDHVLFNSATTATDFLIVGEVVICARNNNVNDDLVISVKPRFVCGAQNIECFEISETIPGAERGEAASVGCARNPIAVCGSCLPGETLSSSIKARTTCEEDPSQTIVGGGGFTRLLSVRQSYCVYLFERITNDFGDDLDGSLGRCIEAKTLQAINNNMVALEEVCASQKPIELTDRTIRGVGSPGDTITLSAAGVWDPADGEVPIKKWFVIGTVLACAGRTNQSTEREIILEAESVVRCGGVGADAHRVRWVYSGGGTTTFCGPRMQFSLCVECAIDEDITVDFSASIIRGAVVFPNDFTYSFKLFCF